MTVINVGSPNWIHDRDEAESSWVVVREEASNVHPDAEGRCVQFVEAEADTGSKYIVVATPLEVAGRAQLGGPVLVSVCSPWHDSYALQEHGLLTSSYVAEHFTAGRWRTGHLNGGDLAALTMTIDHALGRPCALDV